MKERPKPATEYEVGYRKPPVEHQFKKGGCANPDGRPKGTARPSSIDEVLSKPVTITEGGKTRKVPAIEAITMQFVGRALGGDPRTQREAIKLATQRDELHRRRALTEPPPAPPPLPGLLPFRIATYGERALEQLDVFIDLDGDMVLRTWAAEAALARLSPDQLAELNFDDLAGEVEDPAILEKYKP
jgi:hypothetical protein